MDIMGKVDLLDSAAIVGFVESCLDETTGGFSAAPSHDPHLLYTLR
jgi:hypothetical protein